MTSADFCTLSITSRQWLLLSEHSVQTSLGTTRFFPSIYLPHLLYTIPCSYRASSCVADLPSCTAFYTVSVRQTRGLPMGSFPTSGFLQICSHLQHPCLRLYPSRYQVDSGLSPVRNVRRQAHNAKKRKNFLNSSSFCIQNYQFFLYNFHKYTGLIVCLGLAALSLPSG
jgi:hypothetical protein